MSREARTCSFGLGLLRMSDIVRRRQWQSHGLVFMVSTVSAPQGQSDGLTTTALPDGHVDSPIPLPVVVQSVIPSMEPVPTKRCMKSTGSRACVAESASTLPSTAAVEGLG